MSFKIPSISLNSFYDNTKYKVTALCQTVRKDYVFNTWLNSVKLILEDKNKQWLGEITLSAYPECCGACIVHNIVVNHRNKGHGTVLLDVLEKVAKYFDYSVVFGIIPCYYINEPCGAMSFFKKNGYKIQKVNKVKNKNTGNWLIPIQKELK